MCNPRRVQVTATRPLEEAWQREVSRMASLSERVVGEVRARQALGDAMSEPVLRALEARLAGEPSWREVDDGYRCDVDGGYVVYLVDERALLLVATAEGEVRAEGRASQTLEGRLDGAVETTAEGTYYDDGYGGWTQERGEREARERAERQLDELVRARLAEDQQRAEAERERELVEQARSDAQRNLDREARARREALIGEARSRAEAVGVRGRRAFHEVLGRAYRDAIQAYARSNGAEDFRCNESGGVMEIEFLVRR